MADNRQQPNTITTTSTSVTTSSSQPRRARASSNTQRPPSAPSGRIPTMMASRDNVISPQTSRVNNSTEPFPSLSNDPLRSSQLSQVRSVDYAPASRVTTTSSQRLQPVSTTPQLRRRPIGIKRLSSQNLSADTAKNEPRQTTESMWEGRRRSTSAPQRPAMLEDNQDGAPLQHSFTAANNLPMVVEGQESGAYGHLDQEDVELQQPDATIAPSRSRGGSQRLRRVSDAARSAVSRLSNREEEATGEGDEYEEGIVDILDVIDPEVSTLTTLTNVQNSLFVPDLGRWLNRRPTYELTKGPSYRSQRPTLNRGTSKPLPPTPTPRPAALKESDIAIPSDIEEEAETPIRERRASIASVVQEEHYAVLPHGISLQGWSQEDKELLDDHVRHMLHSKREGFKRSMRAFGKYVRKPLGFFVTLYAVLITLFGLAWVLFLIGWIYVGEQQVYVINIIDNVLVALFAIMGDGLAPFRAVDTYHMSFIAYYHHLTAKLRKKKQLPKLQDKNELPTELPESEADVENAIKADDFEFSVLNPEQQQKLEHHQDKFSKSHSFYKPHETTTHWAFPHHLFVAIVILLDMHSCLQIALGSCTWGISYHTRPKALTPTILSCSITVNITAGILIKVGDNKTRKKDVLERMFRQELTEEAIRRVQKDKGENRNSTRSERHILEKDSGHDRVHEESESNRFSSLTAESSSLQPEVVQEKVR